MFRASVSRFYNLGVWQRGSEGCLPMSMSSGFEAEE